MLQRAALALRNGKAGGRMSTTAATGKPAIGWIGLGKMEAPICERLVELGFPVRALVRSADGRERAARGKIPWASEIRGAVDGAELLFPRSATIRLCSTSSSKAAG